MKERVTAPVLANGFRKCGLYPWGPSVVDSFFAKKTPQSSVIEKTSSTYTLRRSIQCIESNIEPEKLNEFKASSEHNCQGQEADASLFTLWRKMYSDLLNINALPDLAQTSYQANSPLAENGTSTNSLIEAALFGKEQSVNNVSHPCSSKETDARLPDLIPDIETPKKQVIELPILTTPLQKSLSDSPSIPSPFKKSLFFPCENEKPSTKRKRKNSIRRFLKTVTRILRKKEIQKRALRKGEKLRGPSM